MPILSFSGAEAVRTRKSNPQAGWGVRGEENRIEPFTRPAFDVPFTFEPGEKIFTVGSCFARNVETELARRGYAIPMNDLFKTPAFEGLASWFVNNYGTPSIYNELAWAFDEEPFLEDDAFVEVSPGKFYDLSLHHGLRAGPIEEVRARRAALSGAIRTLAECRVLIMTLGLVELWWDKQARRYLNTIPLPSILARWPERFALHVLSFEESRDYLRRALDIAYRYGPADLKVILTVSPVPLMTTHRPVDVVVANCYSKSVLRAAAEHVVVEDDRVTYFPSYESVIYSDRRLAWTDDFVHVTKDIVAFNVDRMVNAFTGGAEREDYEISAELEIDSEPEGAVGIIEGARKARESGDPQFFETNAASSEQSPTFLLEHARFLNEKGDRDQALALLAQSEQPQALLLRAEIQFAAEDYAGAIATLRPLCDDKVSGQKHWKLLLDATGKVGDSDAIIAVEREWLQAAPFAPEQIAFQVARALCRVGDTDRAIEHFRSARPHFEQSHGFFAMESAAAYLDAGLIEEARATLEGAVGQTPWQIKRLAQLREQVG